MTSTLAGTLILTAFLSAGTAAAEPQRKKINLPGFEQGDLFLLRRLSNDELVNVERSEWVHVAILIREGLDLAHRREAISELAKLRKTDALTQILDGMTRAGRNADGATGALNDLIGLLMASPRAELKKKREALAQFATDADHELARRAGYAGVMLADGAVDPAWRLAETSNGGVVNLLDAASMIPDPEVRAALYPKVAPLVHNAPSRDIRQSAILAIASIPGRQREAFNLLAKFVADDIERDTAIAALQRLGPRHWPEDSVPNLLDNVMAYLQGVDPTQRNTPTFKRSRQLGGDLASLLPDARGQAARKALDGLGIRIVTVRAVPYSMAFDRVHIVVKAGSPIEITLENPDQWLHNLAIVTPGALAEIGVMSSQMLLDSESWRGYAFVPNSEKVLMATRVLKNGDSDTITFVAPELVGEYPYLCTYPGHWVSMNGILHVVEDVDAWIAANPVKATGSDPNARTFVNAWKLDDLAGDLGQLDRGRSLERGKDLFTAARCDVCHRVGTVGGQLGPEMTEVTKRLKPAEMLAEMLAPSTTINEQYRSWSVLLDEGAVLTGLITKQDDEAIHIVQNPLASADPIRISRDRIEAMKSSTVSTMPMGLLNTLSREEILDLLAYIRSGGGSSSP